MYAFVDTILSAIDTFLERKTRRFGDGVLAYALLTPAMVIIGLFGIAPIFYSVYISLFDTRRGVQSFVWARNYVEALSSDDFWQSVLITVFFVIGTIPVALTVSFLIAQALFNLGRARGFFRTVYFLPYVTSVVAAATVWKMILHPRVGPVNTFLAWVGVSTDSLPNWMLESRGVLNLLTGGALSPEWGPSLALCCVILFEIWHSSGFMIVILLAAMTTLPRELDEAARIDGANWRQRILHVTVPLLSPTLLFLCIVQTVKAFQAFNSFYALTGNGRGPLDTTRNVTVYVFSNFYEFGRSEYAAAVATLLAIAIALMSWIQWRVVHSRVNFER